MSDSEYRDLLREFKLDQSDNLFTRLYGILTRSAKFKDANELIKLYLQDQSFKQWTSHPYDILTIIYPESGLIVFGKIKLNIKENAIFLRKYFEKISENPRSYRTQFSSAVNKSSISKNVKYSLQRVAINILIKNNLFELDDLVICEYITSKNRREKRNLSSKRKSVNFVGLDMAKPKWIPLRITNYCGLLYESRGHNYHQTINLPGGRY